VIGDVGDVRDEVSALGTREFTAGMKSLDHTAEVVPAGSAPRWYQPLAQAAAIDPHGTAPMGWTGTSLSGRPPSRSNSNRSIGTEIRTALQTNPGTTATAWSAPTGA